MEWQLALVLIVGSLFVLMVAGMPVAFAFMFVNLAGALLFWGGGIGVEQLVLSIKDSMQQFTFLPVPLFFIMGEVMFLSGIATMTIDALDKWLGNLPGRLSLLAVSSGTVLSTLTGTSMASTALLGSVLVPEIEKRGYKKSMSLGPILGSGGLAIMIPPSSLAVLLAGIGEISVGRLLIAIVVPGLLMAILYASYIILRCRLQPSIAPAYAVPTVPLSAKIGAIVRHVLPLGVIVFLVIGVILLGVATPSEAAATGALGCFILAAATRRLNWELVKKSVSNSFQLTVMIFIIITGAMAFSQNLAYVGASRGLIQFALGLDISPIFIIVGMQIVVLIMGCFMEIASIMMVALPLFIPIVLALGFNEVWFGAIFLLNIEMATTTPPFGTSLFVMKGVAPRGTTMKDIYLAALPFLGCDLLAMTLIIAFPAIALWLPSIMQ